MDESTVYQAISISGFILGGSLLVVAVFMFIKLNIIAIIGDLSGRTAKKQIQAIRDHNSETGDKRYKPSMVKVHPGILTEAVEQTRGLFKRGKIMETAHPSKKLDVKEQTNETSQSIDTICMATDILSSDTEVLIEGTEVLSEGTEVLSDSNETTVLWKAEEPIEGSNILQITNNSVQFEIVKDIILIHTDEICTEVLNYKEIK